MARAKTWVGRLSLTFQSERPTVFDGREHNFKGRASGDLSFNNSSIDS